MYPATIQRNNNQIPRVISPTHAPCNLDYLEEQIVALTDEQLDVLQHDLVAIMHHYRMLEIEHAQNEQRPINMSDPLQTAAQCLLNVVNSLAYRFK